MRRREQEALERRRQQRITVAAGAVLLLVTVVVAVGYVLTVFMPPREHILTVGDRTFTARHIAERAELAVRGGHQATLSDPARVTIDAIMREEALLQAGAALVDEVTEDDLKQAIRERLDLAEDASDEEYVTAYQRFLRETSVSRGLFERSVSAQIIDDRLVQQYLDEMPAAGPHVELQGVGDTNLSRMQELRDAVAAGADLAETAVEMAILTRTDSVDFGWVPPEVLGVIHEAIEATPTGDVTDVIHIPSTLTSTTFAIYRVADRDDEREYLEEQRRQVAEGRVNAWADEQHGTLGVQERLTESSEAWITRQVMEAATRIFQS